MKRHRVTILVLGGILFVAMGIIASLGDLGRKTPLFLILCGVAHAAYVAGAWLVLHRPGSDRARLPIILAAGLLARILLLPGAPTLSEDVYRYLWDGHLVAHGVNPFPHAPSDPELTPYRNGLLRHLNHADVPTIYPPLAQLLFASTAAILETPLAWKLMLLALETILVLAVLRLLRNRGLPRERLLLYYWNPLVLVESFGSGHVDLAAAALLLLALWLYEENRRARAGIAFALAVLTKLVPAVLLPWLIRRRAGILLATAAITAAVLYAPFVPAGSSLWTGLTIYARHWEFNGAAYHLLHHAVASEETIRRILAAAFLLASILIAWRAGTAPQAAFLGLVAFVLLSPTVFPWYLVPIVALLPLYPDAGMIFFSGAVLLSYIPLPAYRATGTWSLPGWILVLEYGGLFAIWAASAMRARVRQREDAHVEESEEIQREEG
jgi:hypothetical protein